MQKIEEIFSKYTADANQSIQKHAIFRGAAPVGAKPSTNFYFSQMDKSMDKFTVFKFTWNMRNELKRMKNQFSDFYFLSYGRFCGRET